MNYLASKDQQKTTS